METIQTIKLPVNIRKALAAHGNRVVDFGYTKSDVEFVNLNLDAMWDIVVQRDPAFVALLGLLTQDKLIISETMKLWNEYYVMPDVPPADVSELCVPLMRSILVAMVVSYGLGPTTKLLSLEPTSTFLGSFKAMRNILSVATYADARNFQVDGLANCILDAALFCFPSRPRTGIVRFLSNLDFPEDMMAVVTNAAFNRCNTIFNNTFH